MSGTVDGLRLSIHGPRMMMAFTAAFHAPCHVGALLREYSITSPAVCLPTTPNLCLSFQAWAKTWIFQ